MKRIHIWVSGMVQGVAFRYFTCRVAGELSIKGWVKNLTNGKVEIIAEAEEWQLKKFVEELNVGPPAASVRGLEIKEEDYTGEYKKFDVRF